jgi:hypothetical protein
MDLCAALRRLALHLCAAHAEWGVLDCKLAGGPRGCTGGEHDDDSWEADLAISSSSDIPLLATLPIELVSATDRQSLDVTDTAQRGRRLLWVALGVALASRVMIWVVGLASFSVLARLGFWPLAPHGALVRTRGAAQLIARGWTNWDGTWYLDVAAHGYARRFSAAFFPLYPLLVRLLSWGGRAPLPLVGMLVSTSCFLAACVLLYVLVADRFNCDVALWTVVFLSFAPVSFIFQAAYAESLFLLLCVACFWFAQHKLWLLAGLMGLLATLARSSGLLLSIPIALFFLEARGWRCRKAWAGFVAIALPPLGVVVYMGYLAHAKGNALLFVQDERHWHRGFGLPWEAVVGGFVVGYRGLVKLAIGRWSAAGPAGSQVAYLSLRWRAGLAIGNLLAALALPVAIVLLAWAWRRLSPAYLWFAVASLLLPLLEPTKTRPLFSLPRFAVVIFPLAIAGALISERRPIVRWVVAAVCALALIWLTARYACDQWVA